MQDKEYIAVLIQSLEKKEELLDKIIEKNKEQKALFMDEASDPDRLEENMQEKSGFVDQLNELDEGFQQIYDRVEAALKKDKEAYKEEILKMQKLITAITEKSTTGTEEPGTCRKTIFCCEDGYPQGARQYESSKPIL